MRRALTDPPILAFMVAETLIWAAIFYSFPALVLHWQAAFGWSSSQVMGAFSLSLGVQAFFAPVAGRLIDRGLAPVTFPLGALGAAAALVILTQVQTLAAFYAVWAVLGLCMGLTLYDACFAVVTRARDVAARPAITAITLVAGFASTLAYPLTAILSDGGDWRRAVWVLAALVLLGVLPLSVFATRRLEAEVTHLDSAAPPETVPGPPPVRLTARPEFIALSVGLGLSALGTGVVMSHLLPLMAALGVASTAAVAAASMIGPSQVAGRVMLTIAGARIPAIALSAASMGGMALAAGLLSGAAAVQMFVFGFAIVHGLFYGLTSILRPVIIRETLGQARFGAIQGAVVRPSLVAFAVAPWVAALVADLAGYGTVVALCVVAQLAGAALIWRMPRPTA